MGENGAGKSTLLKCLFGIYQKDSGTILFQGKEIDFHSAKEALENGISMVHQELNLVLQRSVMDNMWLGRYPTKGMFVDQDKMYRETKAIFDELDIDIDPRARVGTLSVSQMQMIEIAKAFSYNAKIVIMDEPTLGIDPEGMRELMFLIRSLAEEDGRTILISSHQLYQIQQVCDRVGLFVEGQLIACGRIEDLASQMRREGRYVLEAGAVPDDKGFKELLEHLGNVEEIERSGDFYVIYSSSDLSRELNRKALEGGYSLCHLRQRGNDLDEIYRTYFEKGEKSNGSLNQRKNKGFLTFGREQRQGEA